MCVGAPMQVISVIGSLAHCEGMGRSETIDLSLTGPAPPGAWLLTHVGVAIRRISEEEARQIGDALRAVHLASSGQPFQHLLADLIERKPELPPHLQSAIS